MEILIINSGPLPIPCIRGGGVETLIQMFINETVLVILLLSQCMIVRQKK